MITLIVGCVFFGATIAFGYAVVVWGYSIMAKGMVGIISLFNKKPQ